MINEFIISRENELKAEEIFTCDKRAQANRLLLMQKKCEKRVNVNDPQAAFGSFQSNKKHFHLTSINNPTQRMQVREK